MSSALAADGLVLVLDTCGERASVALSRGPALVAERQLDERTASAALLGAVRSALARESMALGDLAGIGVVSGPGSFTGVRVGLAMAKGLCEATGVRLAAVSRLQVLADSAGLRSGIALLAAGRGQVYARDIAETGEGREWLADMSQIADFVAGREVAVASGSLAAAVVGAASVQVIELSARHAIETVLRCFSRGGTDPALADANYVRNEEAIYRNALVRAG